MRLTARPLLSVSPEDVAMRLPARSFFLPPWLLLVLLLAGCFSLPQGYAPPSPETRQWLPDAAFVAVPSALAEAPNAPAKGAASGALSGAAEWAVGSVAVGGSACADALKWWGRAVGGCCGGGNSAPVIFYCGLTVAGGIVLAPVAGLAGAVAGASDAHSAEEVEAAQLQIRAALMELDPADYLLGRLVEVGATGYGLGLARQPHGRGYPELAAQQRAAVVEIEIVRFGLNAEGAVNPDIVLDLAARARVIGTLDEEELYRRTWRYLGPRRNYFSAADRNAAVLRDDIREGFDRLSDRMLYDLFLGTEPEEPLKGEQGPGTVVTVDGPEAS